MKIRKTQTSSNKKKVYRLRLPAETRNLDIIRKFVVGIAEQCGFSEEDVYNIELAVDEAASNVIKHAYTHQTSNEKIIDVAVRERSDGLEIVIGDKGKGFDPQAVKPPDMGEYMKKLKSGGLGLYLIKKLMDKVSFRMRPGVRNEIRMIKYLKQDG
ncbi:MAG: ATP-binding protein [Calditrichaeota bacterium]|nr:ATP-binding protein [Calditrichota bacterium]